MNNMNKTKHVQNVLSALAVLTLIGLAGCHNPTNSLLDPPPPPPTYTITVEPSEGTTVSATRAAAGTRITLKYDFRNKIAFTGWTVKSPAGVQITNGSFTMPGSDVVITAGWQEGAYNIRIDGGGTGAQAEPEPAEEGNKVTLSKGEREGHKFTGWTLISASDKTIDMPDSNSFTMPADHVIATANWEAILYNITVNANGGGGTGTVDGSTTATFGQEVTLNTGSRLGYTFTGWTVVAPIGLTIEGNKFTMPANDVEVTANWSEKTYTITINQGGGTGSQANPIKAAFGTTVTLIPGNRAGYTFAGWMANSPFSLEIGSDYSFKMPDSNVEVTAAWDEVIPEEWEITVHTGGGIGTGAKPQKATASTQVTLTQGTRAGYTFEEWVVVSPEDLKLSGGKFTMPDEKVEIMAKWKATPYNITITDGGTGSSASPSPATVGQKVSLSYGEKIDHGFDFSGWTAVSPSDLKINNTDYTFEMPASNVTVRATWKGLEEGERTVTVKSEGGLGTKADKPIAKAGDTVKLDRGNRPGYDFAGWIVEKPFGFTIPTNDTFTMPDEHVLVQASWNIVNYTISVEENGGSGSLADKQTANFEDTVTLTRGKLAGHTFQRWDVVKPESGLVIYGNDFQMPDSDVVVKPLWVIDSYRVSFDTDGGSANPTMQWVDHGKQAVKPADPVRGIDVFLGWFEEGAQNAFNFATAITDEVKLSARWDQRFEVSIIDGYGSTASPNLATVGQTVTLKAGDREGYTFAGWMATEGGVTVASDNTFKMPASNVTVTANWTINSYTVTFDSKGGSAVPPETVSHGGTATKPADPTRGDDRFDGWFSDSGLQNAYNFAAQVTRNVTLYAKWTQIYVITLDQGGGSDSTVSSSLAAAGEEITLAAGNREGYDFSGWTMNESALSGDKFTMPAAPVTVTANWRAIDYTITVNQGGGIDVKADKETANIGETVTLTYGTREGYTFDKWTTSPADLAIAEDNTFTMPAANVTVTAHWYVTPESVTITSTHRLTTQGLELTFAASVQPQNARQEVTWSVSGNDNASFSDNVLKVAPNAAPGAITVTAAATGHPEIANARAMTILRSTAHSAGSNHTAAIKSNNQLWSWGSNGSGQLGDSTTGQRTSPVQVLGGGTWVSVSAGGLHTAAIKSNGQLWLWGSSPKGQLGHSAKVGTPAQVSGGGTWVAVSAGSQHTAAIKSDGTLWLWGDNVKGQLGNNSTAQKNVPTQVSGGGTWVSVVTGGAPGNGAPAHSAGIKSDGTLWLWGDNQYGQLGNNSTAQKNIPTQVSGGGTWVSVALGDMHTVAIKSGGSLLSWGYNGSGQLGTNSTTQRLLPTSISGGGTWDSVIAGQAHSAAIKSDGTLWSWGNNGSGRLGDNSTTQRNVPTQVSGGGTWASVSAGQAHSAAIKSNGQMWSWGSNASGQLGNGTTSTAANARPVQVSGGGTWRIYPAK